MLYSFFILNIVECLSESFSVVINSVESININKRSAVNISAVSSDSIMSAIKQAQNAMQGISQLVYQSLSMLTASTSEGISKEGLNNFKTLLENENMTQKNVYALTATLLDKFNNLSADGNYITQEDFVTAVKFSVAQSLSKNFAISALIQEGKLNISSEIAEMYGTETAQTIAIVQFIDNLSDETVSEIIDSIEKTPSKSTIKPDSYYGEDKIQDYRMITPGQLQGPISIYI